MFTIWTRFEKNASFLQYVTLSTSLPMMVVGGLFNDPVYRYIGSKSMRMIKGSQYGFDGGSHGLPKSATWR
jgi:hypothetical protein